MLNLSRETRRSLSDVSPIIVSNRGPVAWLADDQAHPEVGRVVRSEGGGLLTAMTTLAASADALWIATASGPIDHQLVEASRRGRLGEAPGPSYRMAYAELDPAVYHDFYNVIANPLLWFVQHYIWDVAGEPRIDDTTVDAWNNGYVEANRKVADVVVAAAAHEPKTPLVMLQDYHFYLAPAMIREARPDAIIQQFVHIPWPDPGYWRILPRPMRDAIVNGLLGNDIVGFQTGRDARNFLRCCQENLGLAVGDDHVVVGARTVEVRSYPISVDVASFDALRRAPKVVAQVAEVQSWRPEKLVVRVDRMDLSKNIVRGFIAFERMLETNPGMCGHVQFWSFLQPTRGDVAEYRRYRTQIEAEAARVNARNELRGSADIDPIRLEIGQDINRAVAAYCEYDVLLVNSVNDGMHLVAKEGPICNQRDGVLVLSESVGAHQELGALAISISPFHIDEMARAMATALTMPLAERRARAQAIVNCVSKNHLGTWIDAQVQDLTVVMRGRGISGQGGAGLN